MKKPLKWQRDARAFVKKQLLKDFCKKLDMTLEKELNPKGIKMNSFLVRYRVGNKNFEEEIFADNEKAVKESIEMQAEWDFPKKKVKIISIKILNKVK